MYLHSMECLESRDPDHKPFSVLILGLLHERNQIFGEHRHCVHVIVSNGKHGSWKGELRSLLPELLSALITGAVLVIALIILLLNI